VQSKELKQWNIYISHKHQHLMYQQNVCMCTYCAERSRELTLDSSALNHAKQPPRLYSGTNEILC